MVPVAGSSVAACTCVNGPLEEGPGVNAMLESGGNEAVIVLANLDPPIAGRVVRRLQEAFQLTLD